jgi:tetratricopeptide (TPR) repeat protein
MLLRALEEDPRNPYLHYQLGKTYEVYEAFEAAVKSFTAALELGRPDDSFRHDLVIRTMFSMKKAGQYGAAITLSEMEMPNWGHSPDFYFVLGDILLDLATTDPDPVRAFGELLPTIEASWLKCLELGEQPDLAGTVRGRGSFLAAHNLAVIYEGAGNPAQAARYRNLAALR